MESVMKRKVWCVVQWVRGEGLKAHTYILRPVGWRAAHKRMSSRVWYLNHTSIVSQTYLNRTPTTHQSYLNYISMHRTSQDETVSSIVPQWGTTIQIIRSEGIQIFTSIIPHDQGRGFLPILRYNWGMIEGYDWDPIFLLVHTCILPTHSDCWSIFHDSSLLKSCKSGKMWDYCCKILLSEEYTTADSWSYLISINRHSANCWLRIIIPSIFGERWRN
jgi:hypothetical protein